MLISKFKDIYDPIFKQIYDVDPNIQFVRKQESFQLLSELCDFNPLTLLNITIDDKPLKNKLEHFFSSESFQCSAKLIYFNRELYPCINLNRFHHDYFSKKENHTPEKKLYLFLIDRFQKHLKKSEHLPEENYVLLKDLIGEYYYPATDTKIKINLEPYTTKSYWYNNERIRADESEKIKQSANKIHDYLVKVNNPFIYFINHLESDFTRYVNPNAKSFNCTSYPILQHYNFFKNIDVYQFCQDLVHNLTNGEFNFKNISENIPNDIKIQQHGFDLKQSFRHRKK